jgi:hypothetical protein
LLKAEGHLLKARREEKSTEKLDPKEDAELIIEGIYGAAHHYIAYFLQVKHSEHSDKHDKDFLYLRKHGHRDIMSKFQTLDSLRTGDFYGTRTDGERVTEARRLLAEIKDHIEV